MHNEIYRSPESEATVIAKYKELMKHWPVAKEELQIDTRHGSTFVVASGHPQNPPLILLHGMGINSLMWIEDVAAFTKSHRVYAVDILGEPGRSATHRPDFKTNACVEWLEDVLAALGITQTAMVGISLGGYLALRFASAFPDRITKLGLLCPAGVSNMRSLFWLRYFLSLLLLGPFARRITYNAILGKDNMNPRVRDMMEINYKHVKARSGGMAKLEDAALKQLYCPLLLMIGGKDILFNSDQTLLRLAKLVPQLEVIYRKESGHILSQCTREVDRFLVSVFAPD